MRDFCIPLITVICVAFGAATQCQAQTYTSGSLGGSSGFGAGAIGSGLTSGVNNPLVNGSSGLKLDSNSLRSSLDVDSLRAPDSNIGTAAETSVFVPERAQEDQPTIYHVDTTPTTSNYEESSPYNSFAAAGGDPPPPPEKGEDGDGDDYSEDAEDDEQVEAVEQEQGLNWWLWGPIAIVGFIVVMNLLGRKNS